MEEYFETLKTCPLFAGIDGENLGSILTCLRAGKYTAPKGKTILREGTPAIFVGVVLTGTMRVIREDYYGNRSILAHLGPGEVFGESFACAEVESLPVSVVAEEACQYLLINCRRIMAGCMEAGSLHSPMVHNLLHLMAQKNLAFHQKLDVLSKRSTREKLMTYLMQQAMLQGKEEFYIPYDRQALADYLEVDRSGLSAEISKLRKEGKLICEKNRFVLIREK